MTGIVFNIQRFAVHDGPGLRTTVFLKGCPLACAWCHNPESRAPQTEYVRLRHRCMRCGRCSDEELACPTAAGKTRSDVEACPTGALQAIGEAMTAEAVVQAVLRDRPFFEESGGGVTISGGEPLMQAAFAREILALLRREEIHTALDTCGYARWEDLRPVASAASLVLYDLKLLNDDRHRSATGVSNRLILENLRALSRIHPNIRVRIPVIPGVNDDEQNFEAAADFLAPLDGIRGVDLLPYHSTGEAKFERLGRPYELYGTRSPDKARLDALAGHFRSRHLPTTTGDLA